LLLLSDRAPPYRRSRSSAISRAWSSFPSNYDVPACLRRCAAI
jgi:hypothetical protein